jgi:hypothetical protein
LDRIAVLGLYLYKILKTTNMKKSELKALIREVIEETTHHSSVEIKCRWNDNDALKTKRRAEVLTVSNGDVFLKDLDTEQLLLWQKQRPNEV